MVTKASNGWILKFINHGMNIMKEPYEKELLVFVSLEDLYKYLKGIT